METKTEILKLVDRYERYFQNESARTEPIKSFLKAFEGPALFDRKNFVGHITASAYIINQSKKSLLLLHHLTLAKWLQPGGHIDASDSSLIKAALREAKEETGISSSLLFPISESIFDIDSHPIPANNNKLEPAHIHHDISFLFVCADFQIRINQSESTAARWVPFIELSNNQNFVGLIEKIKTLTS